MRSLQDLTLLKSDIKEILEAKQYENRQEKGEDFFSRVLAGYRWFLHPWQHGHFNSGETGTEHNGKLLEELVELTLNHWWKTTPITLLRSWHSATATSEPVQIKTDGSSHSNSRVMDMTLCIKTGVLGRFTEREIADDLLQFQFPMMCYTCRFSWPQGGQKLLTLVGAHGINIIPKSLLTPLLRSVLSGIPFKGNSGHRSALKQGHIYRITTAIF